MTPRTILGANWGEFWPDGTGGTNLTLPPGAPDQIPFARWAADGRVGGKAANSFKVWYWTGARWLALYEGNTPNSPLAFHPTSGEVYVAAADVLIFDRAGTHVRTIPGYVGSNGIRWIAADGSVVTGDQTYHLAGQLGEYMMAADVSIGQGLKGGVDAVVDGKLRHIADGVPSSPGPRVTCVGDAVTIYWTDFRNGYRLDTTLTALRALPEAIPLAQPTFAFNHPVIVAPFKDPGGLTPAPWEIVANNDAQTTNRPCVVAEDSLGQPRLGLLEGVYSENTDAPEVSLISADDHHTRLMLCHDAMSPWSPPPGLRPYDVPMLELYLSSSETLDQSAARWERQMQDLLAQWPGKVGVALMFYDPWDASSRPVYPSQTVLDAVDRACAIVNLDPRIVFLAPFEVLRANGCTGYPWLMEALQNMLAAAARAGLGALLPVDSTKPIPINALEKVKMQAFNGFAKVVSLHGGPYYTGVDPSSHGPNNVYYNRPNEPNQGGAWEEIAFTPHDDGGWDAKYVAANVGLSIQDDGTLQSRSAGGYGPFENLQIRTESGTGRLLLYRTMGGGSVLIVEVKQ